MTGVMYRSKKYRRGGGGRGRGSERDAGATERGLGLGGGSGWRSEWRGATVHWRAGATGAVLNGCSRGTEGYVRSQLHIKLAANSASTHLWTGCMHWLRPAPASPHARQPVNRASRGRTGVFCLVNKPGSGEREVQRRR